MYNTVSHSDFYQTMKDFGFSYEGSKKLFEFLEQREEEMGEKIEFDPVSINMDFTEYESLDEFLESENLTEQDYESLEELAYDCISLIDLENGGFILEGYNGK